MTPEQRENWMKSLTGNFTVPGNMGHFLYGRPRDLAAMLSAPRGSSLRTNALLEFTQRGEWRKAAMVARCMPDFKEELEVVFGQEGLYKLLEAPLGDLPSVLDDTILREEEHDGFHVRVLYKRYFCALRILVTNQKEEEVLNKEFSTPVLLSRIIPPIFDSDYANQELREKILYMIGELNTNEVGTGHTPVLLCG